MSVLRSLIVRPNDRATLSYDDMIRMYREAWPYGVQTTYSTGTSEEIPSTFVGFTRGMYEANGLVFACMATRLALFSQARLSWQQLRAGQPGDLFGTPDLRILEQPEPGRQTSDLLIRALLYADLAGNMFAVRRSGPGGTAAVPRTGRIRMLRPDWVSLILGSADRNADLDPNDVDVELAGLVYHPPDARPETFDRAQIAHWAPFPDPTAHYRGMSWLTPLIREVMSDQAATSHKLAFFENAATPNLLVKVNPSITDKEKFRDWIKLFEEEHKGTANAYRTLYMGGGSDASVIGANLRQIDFKVTQGAGETRVAAASLVHPVVLGLSEGLQGSALNAGNFMAARRLTADKALRPAWGGLAGSLEMIVPPPPGARLWYDERHIPFLAEDVKDSAEVLSLQATAMRTLGDGGWDHDAVVDAVVSGDLRRLSGSHTGLVPVQLQAPGSDAQAQPQMVVAARTFWATSGVAAGTRVEEGSTYRMTDPVVRAFAEHFEVAT